jgi:hypothetical protein
MGSKHVATEKSAPNIGTLQERSLHAALKAWYAQPDDRLEVPLDGYVIDIVRGDLLIEIQTRNFFAMKRKLTRLVEHHRLHLIHPIAREKWITRVAADGHTVLSRRKSPKRGTFADIFHELVACPQLIAAPNFSLEVVLVQEEEIRVAAPRTRKRWRRDWRSADRQLLQIVERRTLFTPSDFAEFIPAALPRPFTTGDLADALRQPLFLAQKMTYCLRQMGVLTLAGKRGRSLLYS